MNSKGVRNVNFMSLSIKVVFTAIFFNITVEFVVQELKRDKKLRKLFAIYDFPELSKFRNFYQDSNQIHTLKS